MNTIKKDLLIIGGGPAGLTSAIYGSRSGLKTVIVEKGAPGGKLNNTHKIDNFPGMQGEPGYKLSMSFYEQAINFGSEFIGSEVISIDNLESFDKKIVKLSTGETYEVKAIIIATGMFPKRLDVKEYDKYFGKGLSVCLVCDGAFYRGKKIAVIGGGNSAIDESLFAADIVDHIYIINSYPSSIAEKIILDKLLSLDNVTLLNNTSLKSINGSENEIESISVFNSKNNKKEDIEVSGVFTYVGWNAENKFITNNKDLLLNKEGFIEVDPWTGKTKIEGVFAAGDILDKPFKQITIATSEGTKAALSAKKYIDENK